jgi:hypothetical protein
LNEGDSVESLADREMMIAWMHPQRRRATLGGGVFARR